MYLSSVSKYFIPRRKSGNIESLYTLYRLILTPGSKINFSDGEYFNFGPDQSNNKTVKDLIEGLSKRWGFENTEDSYSVKHTDEFHEAGLLQLDCKKANENQRYP